MKHFKHVFILLLAILTINGCKKESANLTPSNIKVSTEISTDGSGNVSFTATADNAVTYDFDFGDGIVNQGTTGATTFKFAVGGTYTYDVTVTAYGSTRLSVKKTIQVTVTVTGEQGLFWSDEFNTDGAPDPLKWGYDIGTGSGGWGNSELEYYTNQASNAFIKDGILKIAAVKESISGSQYTSARLLTMNKFSFKYGKVVFRAKLPSKVGTWPALWLLGSNISDAGWPACGEMDVMEHRGSELNKIFGTLHYPGRSGGSANGNTVMIQNASTEFHTYRIDWSSALINIYVDDQLFHTVSNSSDIPFNHDFFIIMNFAMGGTFGGTIDPAFTSDTLQVDYVKVYKQ